MGIKKLLCFLALGLACAGLAGCGASREGEAAGDSPFTVDILATGKSDCAVIRMDGLVIVSDAADMDDYAVIAAALDRYGVAQIDYIILSHYDKDHIGCAGALVENYIVETVLRPDYQERSAEFTALMNALSRRNTLDVVLTEVYTVATEHGSILVDPPDKDYGDDNNNSMVLTVTWEGRRLLFLGDAEKKRMEEFLDAAEKSYDLIKLPHHGDSCNPLLKLLRRTGPQWAVECVSADEIIEQELLDCLAECHIPLYCTSDGEVRIRWDGSELQLTQ